MYSSSRNAVDKGLGFDFSAITDLVKSALPVGLNIYQNQMQLKQTKALVAMNQQYGLPVQGLPSSQMYNPMATFGQSGYIPPSSGMSSTSMALIGGAALVVGLLAYKALK